MRSTDRVQCTSLLILMKFWFVLGDSIFSMLHRPGPHLNLRPTGTPHKRKIVRPPFQGPAVGWKGSLLRLFKRVPQDRALQ